MLVVMMRPGESVFAGETEFKFLRRNGNQIFIGIDAPEDCRILRGKLKHAQEEMIDGNEYKGE